MGQRFNMFGVDPENPLDIYVGAGEGTLIISHDGGLTWDEIDLTTRVIYSRSASLPKPSPPAPGGTLPAGVTLFLDPPNAINPISRPRMPLHWMPWLRPNYIRIVATAGSFKFKPRLLTDAVRRRNAESEPLESMAFCRGTAVPLLVASSKALYGSDDGGFTWYFLFGLPNVAIKKVRCDPRATNRVFLATTAGAFLSLDGGLSFQDLPATFGAVFATSGRFVPIGDGPTSTLIMATGSELHMGDPASKGGMKWVYPDFNDVSTAPWRHIVYTTSGFGKIWLGTKDGLRVSRDGGRTWEVGGRNLFDRQQVYGVYSGHTPSGREQVIAGVRVCRPRILERIRKDCDDSMVYTTTDGGETWHPVFHGLTNRALVQVGGSRSPYSDSHYKTRWWVLARGELWSTETGVDLSPDQPIQREAQQWARRHLSQTPTLDYALRSALHDTELDNESLGRTFEMLDAGFGLPIVEARFVANERPFDALRERELFFPWRLSQLGTRMDFTFLVQLTFRLPKAWGPQPTVVGADRRNLWKLRRHVAHITEDAWRERKRYLMILADGLRDEVQAEILRQRIESLDAVLDLWSFDAMRLPGSRERRR